LTQRRNYKGHCKILWNEWNENTTYKNLWHAINAELRAENTYI
jgi:hypothetical protein